MPDRRSLSRRDLLAGVGLSGMGVLSGCNTEQEQSGTIAFDGEDMQAFVDAVETANRASNGTVIVEKGQYRFDPIDSANTGSAPAHAVFRGLENVTIQGNGATFLFTNPLIYTLVFRGGRNITIRDLAIDYDPVPFTQGTITASSTDPITVNLSLDPDFPTLDHPMFERSDAFYALVHEPDGRFVQETPKRGSWDPKIDDVTKLDSGKYELRINPAFHSGGLKPGRKLTVLARNNKGGLSFNYVDDPTLTNVSVHATNGGAIQCSVCKDPVIRDVTIAPPPYSDRYIGANADGIRIINCRSSATVEGCRHEYLGDDSLVIQHTVSPVKAIRDDRTVSVENIHPFVVGSGDVLDVFSPSGIRKGALPPIDSYESRFSLPNEREKPATITFEASVTDRLEPGDFLRNRATGSQNFQIRDNVFRHHRANLIRIAASEGVIEDNVLEGCPINPIELETDTFGYFAPKGWTSDVTIRNNTIKRAGMEYFSGANPVGIHVHHRPPPAATSEGRPNRNITIEDNEIVDSATAAIHVEATEAISIKGNTMGDLNQMSFPRFADVGLSLDRVKDAEVRDNEVRGSGAGLEYFGIRRESQEIDATDNEVVVNAESRAGQIVSLEPVRLRFDRTVRPAEVNPDSSDERPLAFRCRKIELLDSDKEVVQEINIGSDEGGIAFGMGVWDPSTDGEWRWFGGEENEGVLYLAGVDLDEAATMRLQGYPMEAGISATVLVDGGRVDNVTFDSEDTEWYAVSLETDA